MDKSKLLIVVVCLISFLLTGCAEQSIYAWGNYEPAIYDRLVANNDGQGEEHLKTTITTAEQANKKVPPGVYADYGFMLYRRGNLDAAIAYFDKERKTFPESKLLMDKLIAKIEEKQHPASPSTDKTSTNIPDNASGGWEQPVDSTEKKP